MHTCMMFDLQYIQVKHIEIFILKPINFNMIIVCYKLCDDLFYNHAGTIVMQQCFIPNTAISVL